MFCLQVHIMTLYIIHLQKSNIKLWKLYFLILVSLHVLRIIYITSYCNWCVCYCNVPQIAEEVSENLRKVKERIYYMGTETSEDFVYTFFQT